MWRQRPTFDKLENQVFNSQEKSSVSEQRKSGSIDYTSLNALKLEDYKFFQIEIPGTSC